MSIIRYAEFGSYEFDEVQFFEFFDMDTDPWQKHNMFRNLTAAQRVAWAQRVGAMFNCKGAQCRM